MKKFNVVIIGAGSIGAMKPNELDAPNMEYPLTHAAAVVKSYDCFKLYTIIDTNFELAIIASHKWGCGCAKTISHLTMDLRSSIDVAVIAVNTENHLQTVINVINGFPKLKVIVLEKPCGENSHECNEIRSLGIAHNVKIIVNYTRRFEPCHKTLADNIVSGKYGKIYSARFHYTRGLKRDGCHAIDLANWFFGDCVSIERHSRFEIDDYSKNDLTIPLIAEYERCSLVTFNPCDGRKYSIFELELLTEKGKISIYESGQKIMLVKPSADNVYGKYNSMKYDLNVKVIDTNLKSCLMNLYKEVYDCLTVDDGISCTIINALRVHKVIESIKDRRGLRGTLIIKGVDNNEQTSN